MKWLAAEDLSKEYKTFMPSSRRSMIPNERNLKMLSPRPVNGRARNYGYQRLWTDGRVGPQMGGLKHPNFYN